MVAPNFLSICFTVTLSFLLIDAVQIQVDRSQHERGALVSGQAECTDSELQSIHDEVSRTANFHPTVLTASTGAAPPPMLPPSLTFQQAAYCNPFAQQIGSEHGSMLEDTHIELMQKCIQALYFVNATCASGLATMVRNLNAGKSPCMQSCNNFANGNGVEEDFQKCLTCLPANFEKAMGAMAGPGAGVLAGLTIEDTIRQLSVAVEYQKLVTLNEHVEKKAKKLRNASRIELHSNASSSKMLSNASSSI
mmetsp:Transcript_29005/g.63408  ORF Transcript_29005/g.63408 Transcript_29005/m.63408 type:complete len:250 (+) Transcript_29005:102-851(+)